MPEVFQVLADPTRCRIVDALRDGERWVNELVAVVSIGQPGVSRQLQILEDADFVVVRPEGRRRIYPVRPDRFRELSEWVAGYRTIWESRLARLAAHDHEGQVRATLEINGTASRSITSYAVGEPGV